MTSSLNPTISRLASGDPFARIEAARQLAQAQSTPIEAAAELVRALENPYDDRLTPWVEAALEKIESPPAQQSPQFIQILQRFLQTSNSPDAAFWATTMLGRIGSGAATAVPSLIALLDRVDHPNVQFRAAWALGKIGPAAKPAVPQLTHAAANNGHPRLAAFAKKALEEIAR
jgi:HEAT repeat protein